MGSTKPRVTLLGISEYFSIMITIRKRLKILLPVKLIQLGIYGMTDRMILSYNQGGRV